MRRAPTTDTQSWLAWTYFYKNTCPESAILRDKHGKLWTRFYSLPNGKRYPDSPEELQTILYRHRELRVATLTDSALMVALEFRGEQVPHWRLDFVAFAELTPQERDCTGSTRVLSGMIPPFSALADAVVGEVAEDETAGVLWFDPGSGNVYAPYDGGMDTWVPDGDVRESIRIRFGAWRANTPQGL